MEHKIPKIIHYCWFGRGQIPEEAIEYMKSWKKYCPDYKIIEWNEETFDISSNKYVKEAYENKKFAFVTDFVRLYALYNYGGIYMDTDVEVIKSLDPFLKNNAFSGFEDNMSIPTGIMGATKGNLWIGDMLHEYDNIGFVKEDGTFDLTTNVIRITQNTVDLYGLKRDNTLQTLKDTVTLYPSEYLCPKSWRTGLITITDNTHTIHHFSGSWQTDDVKRRKRFRETLITRFGHKKGLSIYKAYEKLLILIALPKIIFNKVINTKK